MASTEAIITPEIEARIRAWVRNRFRFATDHTREQVYDDCQMNPLPRDAGHVQLDPSDERVLRVVYDAFRRYFFDYLTHPWTGSKIEWAFEKFFGVDMKKPPQGDRVGFYEDDITQSGPYNENSDKRIYRSFDFKDFNHEKDSEPKFKWEAIEGWQCYHGVKEPRAHPGDELDMQGNCKDILAVVRSLHARLSLLEAAHVSKGALAW